MINRYVFLLAMLGLSSCTTHSAMRGSVVMKLDNQRAHVCLGKNEVKVGDRLTLYRSYCTGSSNPELSDVVCRRKKIGSAIVEGVINDHYSTIRVNPGTKFKEGTLVEKN